MAVLFSTTIIYGATSYYYNYTMNIAASMYTDTVTKTSTTSYAKVEQTSLDCVMEYTVVNNLHVAKSETVHVSGADTVGISYYTGVVKGDVIGLKIYNDPADNLGKVRSVSGRWTP